MIIRNDPVDRKSVWKDAVTEVDNNRVHSEIDNGASGPDSSDVDDDEEHNEE